MLEILVLETLFSPCIGYRSRANWPISPHLLACAAADVHASMKHRTSHNSVFWPPLAPWLVCWIVLLSGAYVNSSFDNNIFYKWHVGKYECGKMVRGKGTGGVAARKFEGRVRAGCETQWIPWSATLVRFIWQRLSGTRPMIASLDCGESLGEYTWPDTDDLFIWRRSQHNELGRTEPRQGESSARFSAHADSSVYIYIY